MMLGKNCQLSSNPLFQNAISPFRPMLVKNCQMFSAKKFVVEAILFYFCSRQIGGADTPQLFVERFPEMYRQRTNNLFKQLKSLQP